MVFCVFISLAARPSSLFFTPFLLFSFPLSLSFYYYFLFGENKERKRKWGKVREIKKITKEVNENKKKRHLFIYPSFVYLFIIYFSSFSTAVLLGQILTSPKQRKKKGEVNGPEPAVGKKEKKRKGKINKNKSFGSSLICFYYLFFSFLCFLAAGLGVLAGPRHASYFYLLLFFFLFLWEKRKQNKNKKKKEGESQPKPKPAPARKDKENRQEKHNRKKTKAVPNKVCGFWLGLLLFFLCFSSSVSSCLSIFHFLVTPFPLVKSVTKRK